MNRVQVNILVKAVLWAMTTAAVHAQPDVELEYLGEFGEFGSNPGQFDTPRAITIGNSGEIIIADAGNQRIQVCDISGNCWAFGSRGSGPGQFENPHGVAVDPSDRVMTVETGNQRVQIFDAQGNWVSMFGTGGSSLGQFRIPGGLWIYRGNRILVADENNDRIQNCKFNGKKCMAFGSFGTEPGQFATPRAVAADSRDKILVSERDNHRISVCTEQGECFFFGGQGQAVGQFQRPRELIPDDRDRIVVADGDNHRIQVCEHDGSCKAFGSRGQGPGEFDFPVGVAMDAEGRLYVADQGNNRVQIFRYRQPIRINAGLNDAWFNADTAGQGFFIIVFEEARIVFLAWFTFDTERPPDSVEAFLGEPGHRWLTAQGPYDGDTATLTVYLTQGGVVDSSDPPAVTDVNNHIGTITIVWHDCESGTLTYDIDPPVVMGEIPIRRIVPDNVALCEALNQP